ncbi:MAG TPA: aminodeoxychorismate synthase component I [Burkholderiales bacterium]|nr:aminodeoxychorismate synthase component I [Burkholderiales bacterium]
MSRFIVSSSLLSRFLQRAADAPYALLDGRGPDEQAGVWLLSTLRERIEATRAEDVAQACERTDQAARSAHTVMLLDYELGYWLEPAAALRVPQIVRPPLQSLVFDEAQWLSRTEFDMQLTAWVEGLPEEMRHAGFAGLQYALEAQAYSAAIERILAYIHDGDTYQTNFTWPMHFQAYGAPLALYAALRERQPVEHGAFVQLSNRHVLSLSPELFLKRRGRHLTSKPMKGTAPRGKNEAEDRALAEGLRHSEKDRAENVMIVDLIRNDMGRLARPGSVEVEALFAIEAYPTVHQMVSTVSADIGEATLCEILSALFPCGSITGAPKIRAMQIAQELELGPRGLYTGSIGHLRPGGDFDFNVAIRTIELDQTRHGRLGIGGGIVADSRPDREYSECLDKARFLTALPAAFELIETLRLEPDAEQPYPLLARHLARLGRSAAFFGFLYEETVVRDLLSELARACPGQSTQRVRLTLAQDGHIDLQHAVLSPLTSNPLPTVVVSDEPIDGSNILLRHKTTVRGVYDATLERVTRKPACFDALFFNRRGDLTEGTRSTVYLVKDGKWRTPTLDCGVLDAVMRRELLESHRPRIDEARLTRTDLLAADEIWLSNALRGLFRVLLEIA